MLRYLETYYKSRYLVSEIAIASRRRVVGREHWEYCAGKLRERNRKYLEVAPNVTWIMTPTKVTAHRHFLREYIPVGKFNSWALELLGAIDNISDAPAIYFNPAMISSSEDFFLCDSHWTSLGGQKYVEPVLAAIGVDLGKLCTRPEHIVHQGNCNSGLSDAYAREKTVHIAAPDFVELFKTPEKSVPDFSVRHGVNPGGILGRALIIHSSSYSYVRGLFRSVFSSITEVFSPYVPADVIRQGRFDHVIIMLAERNCAVVYDGNAFGERIVAALGAAYIREIGKALIDLQLGSSVQEVDATFLRALGHAWLGERNES